MPIRRIAGCAALPGCARSDVAAPLQVLAERGLSATGSPPWRRASAPSPVGGLRLLAERTFDEVPHPTVLIVPGGGAPALAALATDRHLVAYVREAGIRAARGGRRHRQPVVCRRGGCRRKVRSAYETSCQSSRMIGSLHPS